MILIILLYALFGASFPMGKVLLHYTTPLFLAGSRMFLAGLVLLAYQYFHTHAEFKFKRKHIFYYAQIIFCGIYMAYILRFWALSELTATKTCFIYNLSPFFASLYSYLFFKEVITSKQWLGLIIGFCGFIPILLNTSSTEQAAGEFFFLSWYEIAVIGSVALHSYSWIVMRKLVKDKSYEPPMVNGITMTAGGLLSLITSVFWDGFAPVSDVMPFLGYLTGVIIISNIICFNLYGHLLRYYTATFVSFAGFMGPLFTAFYGWFFLEESVTWHFYISAAIVFLGLYLFYQDELSSTNKEREEPIP
ncbi:DMT family transporter [Candidatus Dependentiae bacterium]|nr:DMT family transporter [Candidatus Dependentiae bacterium]